MVVGDNNPPLSRLIAEYPLYKTLPSPPDSEPAAHDDAAIPATDGSSEEARVPRDPLSSLSAALLDDARRASSVPLVRKIPLPAFSSFENLLRS